MRAQHAFLIDGTAFCYRAFYAIRNLSTSDGRPTNAVYGFATMLQSLTEKEHPDYLGVAFDVGKPTFRHRKFEAYKIQRKPMPDPLIGQLPLIKSLLAAYRIPMFEQEGYEAEDVLATIAQRIAASGLQVFLVTGDKDALQLVNSHIKVYNPHHDGLILDAQAVRSRYGVGPERMVDLMALMGDDIDNIPGVAGVGERTATQLLQHFGSLEQLYERLDELPSPSRRRQLEAARDQVWLSRELAQIHSDVPIRVTLEDLTLREPDWPALRCLFRELGFKRLLHGLDERQGPAVPSHRVVLRDLCDADDVALLRARLTGLPAPPLLRFAKQSVRGQAGGSPVGMACWGVGTPGGAVVLAVAPDAECAWVGCLDADRLKHVEGQVLARWLADGAAQKLVHDGKLAMRLLGRLGVSLKGVSGDTMLAAYLLNPSRTNQTLSDLADEVLSERLGPLTTIDADPALASRDALASFGHAACAVVRLHERLAPRLTESGLQALYEQLELPLLAVLARIEATGVAIDAAYLDRLRGSMEAKLRQLTESIYELAGTSFNLNSPRQLAQVLFERLRLPVVKRTKTGPSTDSRVLQQLAERHPLPKQLMEYRELSKLVSTYVEALPKLVDPATGRLHTSLNQTATATGRLSSSDPNLQNIPIKTELGRSIRKAFVPGIPDGVFLAADYSQVELRILAHLSGDEQLMEAFRAGRDIHRFTASLIYGLPEAEVQPEQRNAMKAVNFGILYGMTAHGLSQELGIGVEEAQAFIDAYFARYPQVRRFLDEQIARARRDGFVQTLLGRRRYIPEVNSPELAIRQFGERMAVNAPVQGSAADLIKRAMVQLDDALEREKVASRMVLQVHDELLFECPRGELQRVMPLVRRIMEGAIELTVPVTVTLKTGPNWLDLTEVAHSLTR